MLNLLSHYLPFLLQVIALLVVMELVVRCMPAAWRQASRENCYRLDGTRSPNRAYRELRAHNRLRRELVLGLLIVFLTGNAVYQTIEKSMAPVTTLASQAWQSVTGSGSPATVDVAVTTADTPAASPTHLWQRYWLSVIALCGLWTLSSAAIVGWTAYNGFSKFAEGVKARSTEHYHLDITRSTADQPQWSEQNNSAHNANKVS